MYIRSVLTTNVYIHIHVYTYVYTYITYIHMYIYIYIVSTFRCIALGCRLGEVADHGSGCARKYSRPAGTSRETVSCHYYWQLKKRERGVRRDWRWGKIREEGV